MGYLRAILFCFPNASQFGTILSMTPLLLREQFWRFWRIALGRSGTCRHAAFFGILPSMEAEIDDKLPTNSR